jgi:hypothetical protein
MVFSESIEKRYPGYVLDKKFRIFNRSDVEMDLKKFKALLLSKDLEDYVKNKD